MSKVFRPAPYIKQSFFQKLFKQEPVENAIIKLNNLFASQDLLSIDSQLLTQIELKYGVVFKSDFSMNLQEFYAVYWNDYLKYDGGNDKQRNELIHMANLLGLSDEIISMLQVKIGETWYSKASAIAVSKMRLSKEDRTNLDLLRLKLNLPEKIANDILDKTKLNILNQYVLKLLAKKRCSPTNETEVNTMIISFDIPAGIAQNINHQLLPLKRYWRTENLPLEILASNANLQKSELCHLEMNNVKWYETRSAGYGGKQLELINEGTVYLTNKRLVFVGKLKNSIITYDRIVKVSFAANGITIHKDKGKAPVLTFLGDEEIFNIVLKRLIK